MKQAKFGDFDGGTGQQTLGSSDDLDGSDGDLWDFEEYGPTTALPIPDRVFPTLPGSDRDARELLGTGGSLSDWDHHPARSMSDGVTYHYDDRDDPNEHDRFQEMMENLEESGELPGREDTPRVGDGGEFPGGFEPAVPDGGLDVRTAGRVCERCDGETPTDHRLEDGDTIVCDDCMAELENDGPELTVDADEETVGDEWEGEFIYTSWGYNQTNVEFAQIVDVSGTGKTVLAKRCKTERVDTGRTSESLRPVGETFGDEFRLHARVYDDESVAFRGTYPMSNRDASMDGPTRKGHFRRFDPEPDNSVHQTAPGYGH